MDAKGKPVTPRGKQDRGESSKKETPAMYETVKLSASKGKKPVALIFGSYT